MGVADSIFEPHPSNFENQLTFEAVKMILLYQTKISFSFWYKKMVKSSLSIYRDLHD